MANLLTIAVDNADVDAIISLVGGGAVPTVDLTLKRQFIGYLLCAPKHYSTSQIILPVGGPILGNNGQVNKFGKYILTVATQNNDFAITSVLSTSVSTIVKSGNQSLLIAAAKGFLNILDDLLLRNVDVDTVNSMGNTPLILATRANSLDCVTSLVNAGANVNILNNNQQDALSIAVSLGYTSISSYLLTSGTNPNTLLSGDQNSGFFAVKSDDVALLTSLISGGLDLEQINNKGNTVLNVASALGRTKIVDTLILAGANLNSVNTLLRSSLVNATISNSIDAATLLIYPSDGSPGIDISLVDFSGKTALDYANEMDRQEIGGMIEDA